MVRALHRFLAGSDGPEKRALPAGEFLHPIPLAAVAILFLNDHWLKGAGILPSSVTGKLSDFAGLLFFPLLLTAAFDTAALGVARLGAGVDFSLRRYKLAVAIGATGGLFVAIKLSPAVAGAVAGALAHLGVDARIVSDPWDLTAVGCLLVAYWLGKREIARVPLGRIEVIERARSRDAIDIRRWLDDVVACGGATGDVDELAEAFELYLCGGEPETARTALSKLRNPV